MKSIASFTLPAFCLAVFTIHPLVATAADPSPSPSATASAELDPTDAAALKPMIGKTVTVAGKVTSVNASKTGSVLFIHFAQDWNSSLSLVLFAKSGEPTLDSLQQYVGKQVKVTGKLELYKDQLEIKLDSPTSIESVQ
ncbi:MAG: OB-fold nucleic acid binding domain-containing protein [Chthoniobacteraceae bacterium]